MVRPVFMSSGASEKAINAGQRPLGYVGLIKYLKYLKYVPGTAALGNIAQDVGEYAGAAAERATQARAALDDVKKLIPTLDLAKRKAEVVEALRELDRPIVVVVDDVDRVPADEIRTIEGENDCSLKRRMIPRPARCSSAIARGFRFFLGRRRGA
jgi:hypothetical protein